MVTPGYRVADIGTDHGYVPIWLCSHHKIPSALAMDVGEGPLSRARENIALYHMEGRIEARLSDGLLRLKKGEADSIIIAGMGGMLMRRILNEGADILEDIQELILEPQSDREALCSYLAEAGFRIVAEDMVFEDQKYYPILKAVHGREEHTRPVDLKYGYFLLEKKHPVLREYLQKELLQKQSLFHRLKDADSGPALKRARELKAEIGLIEEAACVWRNEI